MNPYAEEQRLLRLERELALKEAKAEAANKAYWSELGQSNKSYYARQAEWEEEKRLKALQPPTKWELWTQFAKDYVAANTCSEVRRAINGAVELANESQAKPRKVWRRRGKYMGRRYVGSNTTRRNAAGKTIGGHSGMRCGNAAFNEDMWIGRRYDAVRSNIHEQMARLAAGERLGEFGIMPERDIWLGKEKELDLALGADSDKKWHEWYSFEDAVMRIDVELEQKLKRIECLKQQLECAEDNYTFASHDADRLRRKERGARKTLDKAQNAYWTEYEGKYVDDLTVRYE